MNAPTSSPTSDRHHRSLLSLLCMSAALACGLATAAMAEESPLPEVALNSGSVTLNNAEARLVRTSMTPSVVELSMPVMMANTVCTEYGQVSHTGQNGARCGYDRLVRRVCIDRPGQCHIDPTTHRRVCSPATRDCHNEVINMARVCTWMETVCVRTEVQQSKELKNVKLKFKNMPVLADGETETYEIHGAQNHLNGLDATYSLASISTKRAVKIKARDGLFTGFKDVITIKGE